MWLSYQRRPLVLTQGLFSSQVCSLIINLNDIPVEAADGAIRHPQATLSAACCLKALCAVWAVGWCAVVSLRLLLGPVTWYKM